MAVQASAEDLQQGFEVALGVRAVDDGEGACPEGGVHFALVVTRGPVALDDDGRWVVGVAGEELEDSDAGLFVGAGDGVEREGKVNDGDVDRGRADHAFGGGGRVGDERADAEGGEEGWEAVDPRVGLPACSGEQEVEAARGGVGGGMGRLDHHVPVCMAKGVPDWGALVGLNSGETV